MSLFGQPPLNVSEEGRHHVCQHVPVVGRAPPPRPHVH
jgi:hypothetical protein